ncbi:hypothetical protein [Bradyrhizobium sp. CCBAU 11434]|uniref:hypothetical protein n=1 Tax=Bradyrhizobium sp. CCBAU 11434 TaxID=1630885 RepID=UPI002304D9D5|nr:hypothetical protein [Bradyrhizobium sp. CCBAU 11434]
MRFETPPGKQRLIDFGERLVEIGGSKVRTNLFVATLATRAGIMSEHSATNGKRAGSMAWDTPVRDARCVLEEVLLDSTRASYRRGVKSGRRLTARDCRIACSPSATYAVSRLKD